MFINILSVVVFLFVVWAVIGWEMADEKQSKSSAGSDGSGILAGIVMVVFGIIAAILFALWKALQWIGAILAKLMEQAVRFCQEAVQWMREKYSEFRERMDDGADENPDIAAASRADTSHRLLGRKKFWKVSRVMPDASREQSSQETSRDGEETTWQKLSAFFFAERSQDDKENVSRSENAKQTENETSQQHSGRTGTFFTWLMRRGGNDEEDASSAAQREERERGSGSHRSADFAEQEREQTFVRNASDTVMRVRSVQGEDAVDEKRQRRRLRDRMKDSLRNAAVYLREKQRRFVARLHGENPADDERTMRHLRAIGWQTRWRVRSV